MTAALLLSAVLAAPVPAPGFTPEEQAAFDSLAKFGFVVVARDTITPRGTHISYEPNRALRPPVPTQKDLAALGKLIRVRHLDVQGAPITDETLDHIARMRDVKTLSLRYTKITDDGLKKLAHLQRLLLIDLPETSVTDEGMKVLATFPALISINVARTKVTDAGVAALAEKWKERKNFQSLSLGSPGVTDTSLASLGKLPRLAVLSLSYTRVTDKGLEGLGKGEIFQGLMRFDLSNTSITDQGLKTLYDPKVLPRLNSLSLPKPGVTEAGIEALKKARPGIKISAYP